MSETLFLWFWAPGVVLALLVTFRILDRYWDRRDRKRHHPAE